MAFEESTKPDPRNLRGPGEHMWPASRKIEELATQLLVWKGRMASTLQSEFRQDQSHASVQRRLDHFKFPLDRAAGGKVRETGPDANEGRFTRRAELPKADGEKEVGRRFSLAARLSPYDPGPWPEGFTVSRKQIYEVDGR